jgi:hypothetical protein
MGNGQPLHPSACRFAANSTYSPGREDVGHWEPSGSQPAPRPPSVPAGTNRDPLTDLGKRHPRRPDRKPNLIRDEEVVGSNPATPTLVKGHLRNSVSGL